VVMVVLPLSDPAMSCSAPAVRVTMTVVLSPGAAGNGVFSTMSGTSTATPDAASSVAGATMLGSCPRPAATNVTVVMGPVSVPVTATTGVRPARSPVTVKVSGAAADPPAVMSTVSRSVVGS
jgi:hypothetical protein